jgi:hypothetical protein
MKRARGIFIPLVALGIYHQYLLLKNIGVNSGKHHLLSSYIGRQLSSFVVHSQYGSTSSKINNTTPSQASSPVVPQNSPWAYAFLLGGARLAREGSDYRGGLFSVVAAAHALRKYGSKADIVLMVQLSVHADPQVTTLEERHEEMLSKLHIRLVYLPRFAKPIMECFYSLVMEKFRILSLTEYSRVMFIDSDILPKCNLDYLFELSDTQGAAASTFWNETIADHPPSVTTSLPKLKENIVLGYKREPSNAGLFVLKPDADDYQLLQQVMRQKEERALELPYPHWDEVLGWGHRIAPDDKWVSNLEDTGTNWTW